jgi:hypothetical protein
MSRDAAMADGVHAAMDRVHAADGEAMSNRTAPEPERQQLTPGYYPVLASRQLRNRALSAT